MAGGTLQNFGVPVGNNGSRTGILMPKVKNRFMVIVTDFGTGNNQTDLTQQVVSVGRPNVSFEPQLVHAYNSISYYAGKATWDALTLMVRDDITNAVSTLINQQLQKQMNFYSQQVAPSSDYYKFNMGVQALDGGNGEIPLETWWLEGCFLASCNFESYEYSSADAMTIEMSIRFDNATNDMMPNPSSVTGGAFMGTGTTSSTGSTASPAQQSITI